MYKAFEQSSVRRSVESNFARVRLLEHVEVTTAGSWYFGQFPSTSSWAAGDVGTHYMHKGAACFRA